MKLKKGIFLIAICCLLCGCNKEQQPSEKQIQEAKKEEKERNPTIKADEAIKIGNAISVMTDDKIPLTYTINNVEIGKERGSHAVLNFWEPKEMKDDTYTADNYSFVWVTATVKNDSKDQEQDFLCGSLQIRPREVREEEGFWQDVRSKESVAKINEKGHYIIPAGQEVAVTLGYIIEDSQLQDMYYQVGGVYSYMIGDDIEKDLRLAEGERYYLQLFE